MMNIIEHTKMPSTEDDVVYYNASLFNPGSGQPVEAYISDIRSQAVIDRPEDWQVSVVRFDITSSLVPPMIVPMAVPATNVPGTYASSLRVVLRHLGIDYSASVQIFCFSLSLFGAVYSIDELLSRYNTALATAFAAVPAPPSAAAPIFVFNPVTQLITLYYQATYVTAVNPIEIYLDTQAYGYVVSLPAAFLSWNDPSGRDFRIQVETSSALTIPAVGARAGYPSVVQALAGEVRALSQAGVSLASMNGVRSILITTSMPISSEALPSTSLAGAQNAGYSSNSLPILSDFIVGGSDPSENPSVDRVQITYLPTAEYRMIQMRGVEPLKRVDLRFFFTLLDGEIRQLLIPPGGHVSAKLLFRRVR
jgi:hypothetical protein